MQLPDHVQAGITSLLDGVSTQDLAEAYRALSERYRRADTASSFQLTSDTEALAYTAARMPATFGACLTALQEIARMRPDISPRTLLDIGSGPGTSTLAAHSVWPGILNHATLIEPNAWLRQTALTLLKATGIAAQIQGCTADKASLDGAHDLVTASYVLNEMSDDEKIPLIDRMWAAAGDTLIVIEAGTPLGAAIVTKVRDRLLGKGAHVVAPCPHELTCPLASGQTRWCHFSVRVERSSLHRRIKTDGGLGYEDERFSWIAMSRTPALQPRARLLGHPHGQKVTTLELCRQDGTFGTESFSKRDAEYKIARKLKWGDAL